MILKGNRVLPKRKIIPQKWKKSTLIKGKTFLRAQYRLLSIYANILYLHYLLTRDDYLALNLRSIQSYL